MTFISDDLSNECFLVFLLSTPWNVFPRRKIGSKKDLRIQSLFISCYHLILSHSHRKGVFHGPWSNSLHLLTPACLNECLSLSVLEGVSEVSEGGEFNALSCCCLAEKKRHLDSVRYWRRRRWVKKKFITDSNESRLSIPRQNFWPTSFVKRRSEKARWSEVMLWNVHARRMTNCLNKLTFLLMYGWTVEEREGWKRMLSLITSSINI